MKNSKDLKNLLNQFDIFADKTIKDWQTEREQKDIFFNKYFSKDNIKNIDEGTLREFIGLLWSFNGWTNKDYLLKEMLKTGMEKIKSSLEYLLYSENPLGNRFDFALKNVRMMGSGVISEVLAHLDHKKYSIWNTRAKEALVFLGNDDEILKAKAIGIKGKQYERYCKLMIDLFEQVNKIDNKIDDLFKLDFFLYYISSEIIGKKEIGEITIKETDHDTIVLQVIELGDGLGFEVGREVKIATGCRVDVIWKSRVANLGMISYAFEVQSKGSTDSAILNLQKVLRKDQSIQKVVLVSDETNLSKFRNEISELDENFREKVGYFEVSDLQKALEDLKSLKDNLAIIGLLNSGVSKD